MLRMLVMSSVSVSVLVTMSVTVRVVRMLVAPVWNHEVDALKGQLSRQVDE